MNTFLKLAKDPSCLLAVHPAFGGSWWSRLKPSDLRVFVGDPMAWDRTMEALNALTGNWAFEIRLYVKDGLTGQVFNNLSQAPLKLYDDLVSSGEASFYLRNYVTMSEWTGWHVIRLEVTDGNASLYLDGIFQATKSTGTTITPVTRDSATDADIGIDYIKLENLTSGAVLWHSEYQDTHAIYKVRDFSTSYQWPAVGTALRTIPWTDDYHFHFVFTVPDSLSNGSYWLMYQSNGRIVFSLDKDARGCRFSFGSFAFADNLTVYTPFQPSLAGTHDVTLTVSGTMLSLALDGTVYEQTGERTASSEYDRAVTTSAPVTIHEITLTDDTSSTEVWHAAYIDLNAKYPALPWPAQVMYSPLPRNFAANPMAWREFSAVAAAVGTDGFSLEITFNRPSKTAGYLFYGDHFFGFMLGATNILCRISVDNYVFIEEAVVGDLSGRHTLKMTRRQGGVDYYLDGALVKTNATAWDVDLSLVFTAGRYLTTDLDGTVESIALMNDTTGTDVWQAAYSDLYDTALPWPSPVPENFAEKAKAFYDCQAVVREALDPTHDYSFLIEAEIVRENPECSMFYAGGDKFPFGVWAYSDNTIRVFSNLLRFASDTNSKYATVVAYSGDTRLQGRHTIEFRIEGDAMRVFLDGNEIEHSYTFARTGTAAVGLPNCNSGYVYKIQITDLTDNQVVWSYPSEAERVRLITKTNVRTDRGAFEAADTSKVSGITTTLDLRGTPVEHTLIVSGYFPLPSNNGLLHYFPLLTQGAALDGTGDRVTVGLLVRVDYRNQQTTRDIQVVWADSSYTLHSVSATVDSEFFDKCHLIAATLLVDRKTSKWTTELYVDGVQLASNTGSLTRFVFGSAGSTTLGVNSIQIQGRIYTGFLSESNKIEYALVIGRVLSAAEIKALTPGKQV